MRWCCMTWTLATRSPGCLPARCALENGRAPDRRYPSALKAAGRAALCYKRAMRIAVIVVAVALPALAQQGSVSAEQARNIVPRADLSDLTDAQRGVFLNVATEVFNYAGCQDTLARCLAAEQKDPHALRMAALVKHMVAEGAQAPAAIQAVETYYAAFEPSQRFALKAENCPTLGSGPVTLVEFSDYQCPHCAHAVAPLEELATKDRKGQVRVCSKYFPFE